jgi:pimeloyl-ACP methyl ester carboxylesterase
MFRRGGSSVRRLLIGYALAADHPDRVVRVALGEAPLPGISPPTPLILPDQVVDSLYRIPFNQAPDEMVATLSDFLAPYPGALAVPRACLAVRSRLHHARPRHPRSRPRVGDLIRPRSARRRPQGLRR